MIRPLVIDDAARAQAARVVAYAMDHPYYPRPGCAVAGDNPNHVAHLDTYRVVFTFSHDGEGHVFRHMSISVPGTKYPNPVAVFHIAELFGFTGYTPGQPMKPPEDWIIDMNEGERSVHVLQPIGQGGPSKR